MSQSQYSDDEDDDYDADDYDSYYQEDCYDMDSAMTAGDSTNADPEYFDFKLLNTEDVERLLNEDVAQLQSKLEVSRLVVSS